MSFTEDGGAGAGQKVLCLTLDALLSLYLPHHKITPVCWTLYFIASIGINVIETILASIYTALISVESELHCTGLLFTLHWYAMQCTGLIALNYIKLCKVLLMFWTVCASAIYGVQYFIAPCIKAWSNLRSEINLIID